jgi:primosomal protein N' (replication factor Y) (superfamily II helicase)
LQDCGLIVVDEEHDASYKQQESIFRYHARDLAFVRAKFEGCPLLLGSATPSLESRERVRLQAMHQVSLREPAKASMPLQKKRVDLRHAPLVELMDAPELFLAEETKASIEQTLERGEQVLVFLNRRGFASLMVCGTCGFTPECEVCSVTMTLYKRRPRLECHWCQATRPVYVKCPTCHDANWRHLGQGTEATAQVFQRLFPEKNIETMDRDQVRTLPQLEALLDRFRKREIDLLVGTQMIVKGHDFKHVALVVILMADQLFHWPDFRASERAYQVLLQVAGRAGRHETPGTVLVQTFNPDHPSLRVLMGEETEISFFESERECRSLLSYPPFGRLVRIRVEQASSKAAFEQIQSIASLCRAQGPGLDVLGPSESFQEKRQGQYRFEILLKSTDVTLLHRILGWIRSRERHITIDVDPVGL